MIEHNVAIQGDPDLRVYGAFDPTPEFVLKLDQARAGARAAGEGAHPTLRSTEGGMTYYAGREPLIV